MTANEIRQSYLRYFERHGHRIVSSSPLVPHDDPTLLFTNAGMNQFKDVFLGRETRDYRRATTSQKCMRVSGKHNDLDNVGPSLRHHTFFEMLGNFSFGDYFKEEAIPFAWRLLTEEWQLPADRLFATIFRGEPGIPRDDEAYGIWRGFLPADHVSELGAADNFWQMGDTGPCGRCSEIYYYRGAAVACPEESAGRTCRGVECSCDRFTEIWNNVFMEFDRQPGGVLHPLPARSIDTGMGLDRVTAVMQGLLSNYENDLFSPLLLAITDQARPDGLPTAEAARVKALANDLTPVAISTRVIADHMRAMTFLIADGVVPSNEWRGYVLRKIMRRAMRHGKRLGMTQPFLHTLVDTVVTIFGAAYPELVSGRDAVAKVVRSEEERFDAVLTGGLPRLEDALDKAAASGGVLDGDVAFRLYDTYGLPRDFIEDMVEDRHIGLDRDGFDRAMEGQREKARAKSSFKTGGDGKPWNLSPETVEALRATQDVFAGYDGTHITASIVALFRDTGTSFDSTDRLMEGDSGLAVLAQSTFYLEAGGQVSDTGRLVGARGEASVLGVSRQPQFGSRLHAVKVTMGALHTRDIVAVEVDARLRDATRRNHTATHLLHAALRQVLGSHVKQAGSLVAPDRLRFDFVHFSAVTPEQQREIETIVNTQILANTPVQTEIKATADAIAGGAMALFGEKYGDRVRVVSVPGFSVELCGGTHVRATGDIGLFVITAESGVAAGVRRIEATTGLGALAAFQRERGELDAVAEALNARPGDLTARIASLQEENRRLARELQQAKVKAALGGGPSGTGGTDVQVAGVTLVARQVAGLDRDALRALVDQHRSRIGTGVVVIASAGDDKVSVVVGVTPDLVKTAPAGQLVKKLAPIVGGGGGGRPDFAEAGGKDAAKIGELLAQAGPVLEQLLGGSR
jgi:alanyl-tRNA synthetase